MLGNQLIIGSDSRARLQRATPCSRSGIELLWRRAGRAQKPLVRRELTERVQLIRMRNLLVEQLKQHVALQGNFQLDRRYGRRLHLQNLEARFRCGGGSPGFEGRRERQSYTAGRAHPDCGLLRPRMAKLHFTSSARWLRQRLF